MTRKDKQGEEKQVWVGDELKPHPEEQVVLALVRELAAEAVPVNANETGCCRI